MSFTVKNLLELEIMKDASLIAGAKGINNEIEFANIMETPEVAKFMRGGEFLITAGFAFTKEPIEQRRLIQQLHRKKVSAFGINLGRYFDSIPDDMIDEANRLALPLIVLPRNMAYMDIMIPIWQRTVNNRISTSEKSEKFYNILLEVVLSQRGTAGICHTLSQLIDNPAILLDSNFNPLSTSLALWGLDSEQGITANILIEKIRYLQREKGLFLTKSLERVMLSFDAVDAEISVVVMPIVVSNTLNGYLIIPEVKNKLDENDEVALEDTGAIIALEIFKDRALFNSQRQVDGEFLDDLISGYYRDEELALRRSGYLNFDLTGNLVFVFIHTENLTMPGKVQNSNDKFKFPAYDLKSKLMEIVHEYGTKEYGGLLISSRSDCVYCLISLKQNNTLNDLEDLFAHVNRKGNFKEKVLMGCSNMFQGFHNIGQAYNQAKLAAKNCFFIKGSPTMTYYNKLGSLLLLNEIKDLPAVKLYCQEYFQELLEYDQKNSGELMKTLNAYFQHNGNLRLTADALYIHKNSVIYRLNKIQQLTGLSLSNADNRFNLQMGLYLLKLDL